MNNQLSNLRIMVAIDAALVTSSSLPDFGEYSLIDYLGSIGSFDSPVDEATNILWLLGFILTFASWGLLLTLQRYAREFYVVPGVLYCILATIGGSVSSPGLFAGLLYAANVYFGIFIGVLYFGPLASLFKSAQQGDAPQPATNADPASRPPSAPDR